MTSRPLAPRVLHRDILDITHHFRTRPVLDDRGLTARYGFRGLMIPILVAEDSVHIAAGTRAMFQTDPGTVFLAGLHEATGLDEADRLRIADAASEIGSSSHLADAVDDLMPSIPVPGYFKLFLMAGVSFLGLDDPACLFPRGEDPEAALDIDRRGAICTTMIHSAQSNHERLNRPSQVRDAFRVWRLVHRRDLKALRKEAGLHVSDPEFDPVAEAA